MTASIDDFHLLDIRVGRILTAEINAQARKPAFVLTIDFGSEVGVKTSSAQLCDNYTAEDLVGRQILAIVNLPPRRVAGVNSQVLVLAVVSDQHGTVLITPDRPVQLGDKLA